MFSGPTPQSMLGTRLVPSALLAIAAPPAAGCGSCCCCWLCCRARLSSSSCWSTQLKSPPRRLHAQLLRHHDDSRPCWHELTDGCACCV